jgi:ATP-binding cassette, subfamily G (WHITE), eye pigment precursor transporter
MFYRSGEWHRKIGFVQRNDELYPKLTVRETILYAARLKMKNGTKLQHQQRTDQLLKFWRLAHLADVFVEDIDNEMLSVGNRKRLAIAVHTVHSPNVLFLDEPTVGFDPRREEALVEDLKCYAQSTRTIIILTINPIRANTYDYFSRILILCHGQTVYFGSVQDALWFFQKVVRLPFTKYENYSDYFMNIVTLKLDDSIDFHRELDRLRDRLREKWDIYRHLFFRDPRRYVDVVANESSHNWPNSFVKELGYLISREFLGQARDYPPIIYNILQRLLVFTLLSFIYFQIGSYPIRYGLRTRFGLLIFITVNQASLILAMMVPSIGYIRPIIERERLSLTCRVLSIYLAKLVSEIPLNFLTTIAYSFLIYYVTGLRSGFNHFLVFVAILLLEVYAVMGLGFLVSCCAKTRKIRDILSILVFLTIFMFGGNQLQNRLDVSWIIRWFQYLSPVFYAYIALLRNELEGNEIQGILGDTFLIEFRARIFSIWACAAILFGLGTVYFALGYLALRATTRCPRYIF